MVGSVRADVGGSCCSAARHGALVKGGMATIHTIPVYSVEVVAKETVVVDVCSRVSAAEYASWRSEANKLPSPNPERAMMCGVVSLFCASI